ncbi:MAG: hypothetical protein HYX32_10535 [Actinobacteria bacterium]|nr:hypothetical protein [Actinomycetota bacterium]
MTTTDRPVPKWAAGLIAVLSRDRPAVVTTRALETYLEQVGSDRRVDEVASDLQQLGWLATLHIKGAWAFVPAGEARGTDPYLDLRGWRERDPDAVFALAGEAAAWHLGYLPRQFVGSVALWLPKGGRVAHGLRPYVRAVRIGWGAGDLGRLRPTPKLLRRKGLDLTQWSNGLPALGPEALLVQLAARPSSFQSWADLVGQLEVLASDCDSHRVVDLLAAQSASAWQRAAYLLERGGEPEEAIDVFDRRPHRSSPAVQLGEGPIVEWSNTFKVNDRLVAPLQRQLGKA